MAGQKWSKAQLKKFRATMAKRREEREQNDQRDMDPPDDEVEDTYACKFCHKSFTNERSVVNHQSKCASRPGRKSNGKEVKKNASNGKIPKVQKTNGHQPTYQEFIFEIAVATAYGEINQLLRGYAESAEVPFSTLARRVAKVISNQTDTSGEFHRTAESLFGLRHSSTD